MLKRLGPGDVFVCPFSVAASLSMILTSLNNDAASQIKTALHLNEFNDEQIVQDLGTLFRTFMVGILSLRSRPRQHSQARAVVKLMIRKGNYKKKS